MDEDGRRYAGFWRRVAAYAIDTIIITFALNQTTNYMATTFTLGASSLDRETLMQILTISLGVQSILLSWAYFAGMESSPLRATIGKRALGLYVTDLDGERLSIGRATGRYFGKIISGVILGIGYIMAGTTENKQAFHDQLAGTLVYMN